MKAGLFSLHYCKIQKIVVKKKRGGGGKMARDLQETFCLHL